MILEALEQLDQPATFFCLGWIARKFPKEIRKIAELGHEVGSHSMVHSLVYRQTPAAFADEVRESKDLLEQVIGGRVRAYRAPGFSITGATPWAFDILASQGFEIDSSVFPAPRAHGGLPGFDHATPHWIDTPSGALKSFPMNTRKIAGQRLVFTGGGYFRLIPGFLLERWVGDTAYVMTYFHPRDFDPGQPVLEGLSAIRRFKAYVGLRGALPKLERLLERYQFTDLAGADRHVDWAAAPRVFVADEVHGDPRCLPD
ncbi:polysaccharide deacetylase family protein [Glycocaulis abyssi]|uniref:Chitooligosaccharide deacetylase n=1 Tax=Glycocaulis abyssi TaxID=1433403 RepID=A0ABV9NI95_9PROT